MNNLVSIVVPTYGRPDTLKRAIHSALNQTYSNIEVVVVDDNDPNTTSRVSTESVITGITDKRLKYIKHQKNRNGAAARNTGIQNANGRYIAFLDDDDEFEPTKIEEQLHYLKDNEQFDLVYCKAKKFKNNIFYYKTAYNKEGNIQYDILTMSHSVPMPSLLICKNVLKNINGFNEDFIRHQDYEILLRINENYEIGCVDKYLVKIHSDDIMNQSALSRYEKNKEIFLNEFKPHISKYGEERMKDIYKIHYFDLCYYAFKHGNLKKTLRYFIKSKPNLIVVQYAIKRACKIIRRNKLSLKNLFS